LTENEFIEAEKANYPVAVLCRVLGVSRSGLYRWRARGPSRRAMSDRELLTEIRQIHEQSRGTYGSPRVTAELRARGHRVGHNRVARLMRANDIRAKRRRRFCRTTDSNHTQPIAPNRLNRQFNADEPNRVWVSDITYVRTGQGWLYLATVIDLFSRLVVGWSMSKHIDHVLACNALSMAIGRRRPGTGLLHHSDRGVQYASAEYQELLRHHGMICSMSRKGDCLDNAVAESFFSTLELELLDHFQFTTREQARAVIFEYIEVFYNRRRRHSTLGYLTPSEYEARLEPLRQAA